MRDRIDALEFEESLRALGLRQPTPPAPLTVDDVQIWLRGTTLLERISYAEAAIDDADIGLLLALISSRTLLSKVHVCCVVMVAQGCLDGLPGSGTSELLRTYAKVVLS